MTEQIVYHEEHHELFALSLYKLNVLTSFSDKSGNSFFLQALCKYLSDNQSDSVVRNVQKVLCMLLKECKDDWQKQLATELFHTYILPSTSNGNTNALNKVLLINAVELFVSTYINKEAAAVLTFEDLLLLAYAWGIIIESDSTPDDTVLSIKANMPHVVVQAKKLTLIMQSNESTSLLQWAKQLVSSLNWCTQVYFRPIFQHVEGHKLIFPMCLKTVCDITEPDIVFKDCYGEGTGLTAWLQCMVVDPGLLPTSSLKLEFNSVSEQDMFCNGMTVALCQLLPNSTEDEWVTIIEALIALVVDQKLFVQLHSLETHSMPWININECFVPLTIIELLHKVTVFLTSPCCESWMNVHHWCRYAKNYAVNTKNLFLRWIEKEGFTRQSHLFMLFCFFGHTCGLICLFELNKTLNMSKPVDSCFVLTLDLMNEFCKLYSIVVVDNEESESTDLLLLRQSIEHKNQMLNIVKAINNKQIKETLSQKLNKL
uniref:Uncharacterized protein LOC100181685 n=1 Tax=Phallusia mammillata TaxID=59560 RepID=A0A6F9DGY3_9ASCI|nr:uncharacterized protein LOC100181685 [Phallusia mammillata]